MSSHSTDVSPSRSLGLFSHYWPKADTYERWLESVHDKADLWHSYTKRAKLDEDELARVTDLPGKRRVLVLTEDWCGDAVRSVPMIAALAEASDAVELRVLDIDEHPEALDGRTTKGARAIPIVVVFDEQGRELGQWGPRPAALQSILRAKIRTEGRATSENKAEYYAPIMGWYAKDKGHTVAQEMLMLLERD